MNVFQKIGAAFGAMAVMLVGGAQQAMAAVPTEVTTAITEAGTDTKTVAGAVLAVMIGIAVFLWIRRAAR